jgi:hypothetical protein
MADSLARSVFPALDGIARKALLVVHRQPSLAVRA